MDFWKVKGEAAAGDDGFFAMGVLVMGFYRRPISNKRFSFSCFVIAIILRLRIYLFYKFLNIHDFITVNLS